MNVLILHGVMRGEPYWVPFAPERNWLGSYCASEKEALKQAREFIRVNNARNFVGQRTKTKG